MSDTQLESPAPRLPEVLPLRLVHVLTSPRATFETLVTVPHWVGPLLLLGAIAGVCSGTLLSTQVGRQAAFDESIRMMEGFTKVSSAQYEAIRHSVMDAPAWQLALRGGIGPLIAFGLGGLVLSGLIFGLFSAVASVDVSFRQLYGIVCHSMVVFGVKSMFTAPLSYARESLTSSTSLGIFFPMLEEGTLPARLLGSIDLFFIWWLAVLAIGLSVLYRRPTRGVLLALLSVYVVIASLIAVVMTAMAGA